jgi:hypothetical protein
MGRVRKPALITAIFLTLFLGPSTTQDRQAEAQETAPDWGSVNDFVYQLQNIDLDALGKTKFDLVIMD